MQPANQSKAMVIAKPRRLWRIAFILAFALPAIAADPPADLARRVAAAETRNRDERLHYTYRQTVKVEEIEKRGGRFLEVRDVVFSPEGERSEVLIGSPMYALTRLRMTEEDFRDIRDVQPFLFTSDQLWAYDVKYKGEEVMDGAERWVIDVRPKQILDTQRLFEGLMWVSQEDFGVVRSEGKAVPDILGGKTENLFPHFTTLREKVDGKHWFPVLTVADDTLFFSNGGLHMKMRIEYAKYQRFGVESKIQFETQK
jgi:hypothetical protein